MRVLFFNHEQYTDFESEAGNLELRLPMLECGKITEHQDYIYQRVQNRLGFDAMIQGALDAVRQFKPDLVVNSTTWPHKSIPPGYIADIEALGYPVLTVFWDTIPDQAFAAKFERPLFLASSYFCECGSFFGYARYRLWNELLGLGKGVLYLTGNNVLVEKFHGQPSLKTVDVALIGSLYENRIELLGYLNDALAAQGLKVEHFGGAFNVARGKPKEGLSANWLDQSSYREIINKTKILLCPAGDAGQWGVRGKIFEALSCGAFCLVEHTPDTAKTIPKDVMATYSNPRECLEKINYFLKNDGERNRLAEIGHRWFMENYNCKDFWKKALTTIENNGDQFLNTAFVEQNYVAVRNSVIEALDGREPTIGLLERMNFSF